MVKTGRESERVRIGELARQTGLSPQTIRFYERRRLLRPAARTASGYRVYDHADVEIVGAIKEYRGLGFTLREVRQFLDLHESSRLDTLKSPNPKPAADIAREKLCAIEEEMRKLDGLRRELIRMLAILETGTAEACPVARRRSPGGAGAKESRCRSVMSKLT